MSTSSQSLQIEARIQYRASNDQEPETRIGFYETSSMIFLEVYSPVSARASTGKKDGELFEKRQVAEAGNSSSAR